MNDEPIIEPHLSICDSHHHLWEQQDNVYLLEDFQADVNSGHRVTSTVHVQANCHYYESGPDELRPVGETEWIVLRATDVFMKGIVGYVDLRRGTACEEVVVAHIDAGKGRFCGVRHNVAWSDEPSISSARSAEPGLLGSPHFREGAAVLARHGLCFDATLFSPQLGELIAFATAMPDLCIVLEHFGIPLAVGTYAQRADEVWTNWRRNMSALAVLDNVVVKLGGLNLPAIGPRWPFTDRKPTSVDLSKLWEPTVSWCIETFGADRCMFESAFPVDRGLCSYVVLWNAFKLMTRDYSRAERDALFSGTATRVYRLSSH